MTLMLLVVLFLTCAREEEQPPAPIPVPSAAKPVTVTQEQAALLGCYRTHWRSANPFPRYRDASFLPPETFELTTVPVEPGTQRFVIKGVREGQEFMFAEWEIVSAKEATLTWGTGFVGFTISVPLPVRDGVLHGAASTFADVPEEPDIAKVELTRIACQRE